MNDLQHEVETASALSAPLAAPSPFRARARAAVEVTLTSGFPTQLALGVLLFAFGMQPFDSGGRLSMLYVMTLWVADTIVLVAIIVALVRLRGERLDELLLGSRARIGADSWLGLALIPVLSGVVIGALTLIRWAWPELHNVQANPFEALIRSPRDAVMLGVVAVLSGGIKEEMQRAFVLRRFDQQLGGARVGLVVFSLAFGAGHFIQGWDVGLVTTLLGFGWGVLYLWRGSITASAVSHSGFNVVQILQYAVLGS